MKEMRISNVPVYFTRERLTLMAKLAFSKYRDQKKLSVYHKASLSVIKSFDPSVTHESLKEYFDELIANNKNLEI